MFAYVARDYLSTKSLQRLNPLKSFSLFCPTFVVADFIYLEGFLFSVEFIILLALVVKFFSPNIQTQTINTSFTLATKTNNNHQKQSELVNVRSNVLRILTKNRETLYYQQSVSDIISVSERVLENVFKPYNQQTWLVKVYESIFPLNLQELATNELKDANLADE